MRPLRPRQQRKIPKLRHGGRTTLPQQLLRAANCPEGYIPATPQHTFKSRERSLLYQMTKLGWMTEVEAPARNGTLKPNRGHPNAHQRKELRYHLTEKGRTIFEVAEHQPELLNATLTLLHG